MNKRTLFFLFGLALLTNFGIASVQKMPAYMDADYYYADGIYLAQGKGFTEPFLWNYLDGAAELPHPSHAYWMPLTSILAALGMRLARGFEFASAQSAFILLSALIPPMTASLAYRLSSRKDLALVSAFLALFSGYYAVFVTTTDTFSPYIVLGGGFFLALGIRKSWLRAIVLGFIAALMHLSRADGAIWFGFAFLALFYAQKQEENRKRRVAPFLLLFSAYLLLVLPWLLRNVAVFGSPLAPGGEQMLWQTSYNQIFAYPAGQLSWQTWLASGWHAIFAARLWAFKLNLGTLVGVQGGMILLPFILLGAWSLRRHQIVRLALPAWMATLAVMTLFFPFAGARGGFFHSGAALQMVWWSLAPIGVDRALAWAVRHRGWRVESGRVFQSGIVAVSFLLTAAILWMRLLSPSARNQAQNTGVARYRSVEKIIAVADAGANSAVIVSNPPGYFLASNRTALALPDGNLRTVSAIAARYDAKYLILEEGAVTDGLLPVFEMPSAADGVFLLDEFEGVKIFVIERD